MIAMMTNKKNPQSLNILLIASEMYPFAKVGGLGDVVASLAGALRRRGHDARVVIPRYARIDLASVGAHPVIEPLGVWMGNVEEWCSVYGAETKDGVPVYFIEHQLYYDRPGIYHDGAMRDYDDNPRRFAFLCRAALQLCKDLRFRPDIVHVNDWQTALAPAYLKVWHWNDEVLGHAASLLTVHNVAYQGVYPKRHYDYVGLGWSNFTDDKIEAHDQINFLKAGIHYADGIVAVSPTFAKEIRRPAEGFGLAPYFERRSGDLCGILNGIDYAVWNPKTDPAIHAQYDIDDVQGKKACKRALQKAFGLVEDDSIALIGTVGRLVEQKGYRLIRDTVGRLLDTMKVQFIALGQGEESLESFFGALPEQYPGRTGAVIGFDDARAHQIIAGSDFFLMPSQWEPCGLNQMYAQRYGTLPIVRAVGGLDDSVENYDERTGSGTGFTFNDYTPDALYGTVDWALRAWYERPAHIQNMIRSAMKRDFSWESSAAKYEEAYRHALDNKKKYDEGCTRYYWQNDEPK
jgi:starch synthase